MTTEIRAYEFLKNNENVDFYKIILDYDDNIEMCELCQLFTDVKGLSKMIKSIDTKIKKIHHINATETDKIIIFNDGKDVIQYGFDDIVFEQEFLVWDSKELTEKLLSCNGDLLKFVPPENITKKCCEIAIKSNGLSLEFVPDDFRTVELYKLALLQNGLAIKFINMNSIEGDDSKKIIKILIKTALQSNGMALEYIPDYYKVNSVFEIALFENGNAIQFIPESKQTLALCKRAIFTSPESLKYIKIQNIELCKLAITRDYNTIEYIQDPKLRIFIWIMHKSGSLYQYVTQQIAIMYYLYLKNDNSNSISLKN